MKLHFCRLCVPWNEPHLNFVPTLSTHWNNIQSITLNCELQLKSGSPKTSKLRTFFTQEFVVEELDDNWTNWLSVSSPFKKNEQDFESIRQFLIPDKSKHVLDTAEKWVGFLSAHPALTHRQLGEIVGLTKDRVWQIVSLQS